MAIDYREQYKRHLLETGMLEIYQRYIDEMKAFIESDNLQVNEDKNHSDMVREFLNASGFDQQSFDEFSVIWPMYKSQCGDMGKIMQTWINDQYATFLKLKNEWECEQHD